MGQLISIIGASGIGKTALAQVLAKTGQFQLAFEQHEERPFQVLYKKDSRYGLANQIDYFLLRAEQEQELRKLPQPGLIDGGLDLDYHVFTRIFHHRGLLTDPEHDLCKRLYTTLRGKTLELSYTETSQGKQQTVTRRVPALASDPEWVTIIGRSEAGRIPRDWFPLP